MLRFNSEIDESVITKEIERKNKIEKKTKEIISSKGSINRQSEIRLPKIRSSSSLLQSNNKSTQIKHSDSPNQSGSTHPSTLNYVNRSKSMLQINHSNSLNTAGKYSHGESPSASFLRVERGELFPVKDKENMNEQR